ANFNSESFPSQMSSSGKELVPRWRKMVCPCGLKTSNIQDWSTGPFFDFVSILGDTIRKKGGSGIGGIHGTNFAWPVTSPRALNSPLCEIGKGSKRIF